MAAIVPHGVDTRYFHPPADRGQEWAQGRLPGRYGVGIFGRVRRGKGTDLFVEAMLRLLPRYPDFTAVIIGPCKIGTGRSGRSRQAHCDRQIFDRASAFSARSVDRGLGLVSPVVDRRGRGPLRTLRRHDPGSDGIGRRRGRHAHRQLRGDDRGRPERLPGQAREYRRADRHSLEKVMSAPDAAMNWRTARSASPSAASPPKKKSITQLNCCTKRSASCANFPHCGKCSRKALI